MPRTPLIAGNWKMNGLSADGAALAEAVAAGASSRAGGCEMLICPPATLLHPIAALLGEALKLGGQDCHAAASGAHTGDCSAEMLADAGCSYVIVGHSERRQHHGEDDAAVRAKAEAAHRAGLVAIVCVGETRAERDAGETLAVIARQIAGSVPPGARAADSVVAYEPVWAIGTGLTATPADAQTVHAHIRAELARSHGASVAEDMRLLYGGSMKPENAADLLAQPDIDGGLIGGASLKAPDFLAIADAAAR
ncbi:MAG: triose-phosphate isomerase [Alphaproteobacteria bacterium]|nr:triose-phosphate isomerase [Alphaproteobacteria bacterium]